MDLNDPARRRALYKGAGSAPALTITEGLLRYSTVEALAAEAAAHGGIGHWISDITTGAFSKNCPAFLRKTTRQVALPINVVLEIGMHSPSFGTAKTDFFNTHIVITSNQVIRCGISYDKVDEWPAQHP